jgi:hypothetical protein
MTCLSQTGRGRLVPASNASPSPHLASHIGSWPVRRPPRMIMIIFFWLDLLGFSRIHWVLPFPERVPATVATAPKYHGGGWPAQSPCAPVPLRPLRPMREEFIMASAAGGPTQGVLGRIRSDLPG